MHFSEFLQSESDLSFILKEKIKEAIYQNNGWISFSQYMEMALYEPGLGYYSRGEKQFGKDGDFITAPEISPLFGKTIAKALLSFIKQSAPHILEIGAGSGRLAHDVLAELMSLNQSVSRYDILDVSGGLKPIQQQTLKSFLSVRWIDSLPESFTGVILCNEVLDAMPVHRIMKKNGQWHELGVCVFNDVFVLREMPAEPDLQKQIACQIPNEKELPEGYVTEIHLHAAAFLRTLAQMQKAGGGSAVFLLDYGYPAREYYLPERTQGTFLSYYRHQVFSDPFLHIGLQDMTSHINFSMMAKETALSGIDLLCYANQADFLLANGIMEYLQPPSLEKMAHYLSEAKKVHMLLSPVEMGEIFKVMIIGNLDLPLDWVGIDRSERL